MNTGVNVGAPDVVSAMKMVDKGTVEYFADLYKKVLIQDAKGKLESKIWGRSAMSMPLISKM